MKPSSLFRRLLRGLVLWIGGISVPGVVGHFLSHDTELRAQIEWLKAELAREREERLKLQDSVLQHGAFQPLYGQPGRGQPQIVEPPVAVTYQEASEMDEREEIEMKAQQVASDEGMFLMAKEAQTYNDAWKAVYQRAVEIRRTAH